MPKRNLIWIAIALAMMGVMFLFWPNGTTPMLAPSEFHAVQLAYDEINDRYYRPVDSKQLQREAVRAMVAQLDEFSTYLPPEKAASVNQRVVSGEMNDLGLVFRCTSGGVVVIGPIFESPAHQAGIFGGEIIVSIDGRAVKGQSEATIHKWLKPRQEGQSVALVLQMPGQKAPRTVELSPKAYPVETVRGIGRRRDGQWQWVLPICPQIAYVRVTEICPQTPGRLANCLNEVIRRRKPDGFKGMILDLRANPGGVLTDGIAVADQFLAEGEIITVMRREEKSKIHLARAENAFPDFPLVVLIDEHSASAAELITAALADQARCIVVGQRTRGKGCVQTLLPLSKDVGQINLTTAEFFIDLARPIQRRKTSKRWGVDPDIPVAISPAVRKKIRELDQSLRVVPNPAEKPAAGRQRQKTIERRIELDAQLSRAVLLLQSPDEFARRIKALQKKAKVRHRQRRARREQDEKNKSAE